MKVNGFDGRIYNLQLNKKTRGKCSDLHKRARFLIKEIFPLELVFEEITLPGSKTHSNSLLYLDFLLPSKAIGIEVQGQQHIEYTPFFHGNKQSFGKSQNRDNVKEEWCELNNIILIQLPYNESNEEWKLRIVNRHESS